MAILYAECVTIPVPHVMEAANTNAFHVTKGMREGE